MMPATAHCIRQRTIPTFQPQSSSKNQTIMKGRNVFQDTVSYGRRLHHRNPLPNVVIIIITITNWIFIYGLLFFTYIFQLCDWL